MSTNPITIDALNGDSALSSAISSPITQLATRKINLESMRPGDMENVLKSSPSAPEVGDLVEGKVVNKERTNVYIDLAPFGTGIIYGREFLAARDVLKRTNPGDIITAKVVDLDNADGYIELSLKEARQAMVWREAEELMRSRKIIDLAAKDANKGGLIIEWQGVIGFLPASQLSSDHYPRVEDGDKDAILRELKKLVGKKLNLVVITADANESKLIFSEKNATTGEKAVLLGHYQVGDAVDGTVTGAVDFGIFVKLEDGLEGLVHISEIDWALVENPRERYSTGSKIRVKVIEIKDGKISLSVKALKPNPWIEASKKYNKGEKVDGLVIKYNKYGALVSIEEGVAGLVHISEFDTEDALRAELGLGKTYNFTITLFEPDTQRMTLTYKGNTPPPTAIAKKA